MSAMIVKRDLIAITTAPSVEEDVPVPDHDALQREAVIAEGKLQAGQLLDEARAEADTILQQAKVEAERIVAEARSAAAKIRDQAAEEGYRKGFQKGSHRGQESFDEERRKLEQEHQQRMRQVEAERKQMIAELEPKLVDLALQIARRVLHSELKAPERVLAITRAVLAQAEGFERVTLKVSTGDYNTVVNFCKNHQETSQIQVEADTSLENGSCIAETPFGIVDGSIEGQLEEIDRRLKEARQVG